MIGDILEFGKSLGWYAGQKAKAAGLYLETGKSLVVTVLKLRRGTYQKSFLHTGMIVLTALALLSAPVIVSQYPTAAAAGSFDQTPLTIDVTNSDTQTKESDKPRRDIETYEVKGGDTLSSIAKQKGVDADSIAYLNNFSVNKILKPGDEIKIPPVSGVVVTVKSGDTISSLAKRYGLPAAQPIVDWPYNIFANDETFALTAGQQLVIPGGKPPAEVPVAPRYVNTAPLFAGGTGQFAWPVGGVMTQYFAWYHTGVDIANNFGTAIVAADSGRVVLAQYLNYGYGWHVVINHGNGYQTLYGHLSKILVAEGDNITRGQTVGLLGSTGRSTGPHLHFEIRTGNAPQNPLSFLK